MLNIKNNYSVTRIKWSQDQRLNLNMNQLQSVLQQKHLFLFDPLCLTASVDFFLYFFFFF